MQTFDVIRHRS